MVIVVMVINQVVAVVLNHVMTVVVIKAVMTVIVLAVTAHRAVKDVAKVVQKTVLKAVLKIAVTVIQHHVKTMAIQQVMHQNLNSTVKDQLATVHVASATVALLVTATLLAIVAVAQMQVPLTAVLAIA